jgi:hypothetical protein
MPYRKTKILLLSIFTLIIMGGTLFWYATPRTDSKLMEPIPTTDANNSLEGRLQSVNCRNAGAGCAVWVIELDNKNVQGLIVSQDIAAYANKRVKLTGKYTKVSGPSSPSLFEVQSIQSLE